jgi:FtsP/CotA-like multicopper oxidase with cupredoxin domain
MAVAETVDVIVEPSGQDAFTIFAQSMDRTGYARGTLATREGLGAPVPDLDPHALLTMADMGHGGMGHDMAAMGGAPAGVSPVDAKAPSSGSPRPEDPHAGHTMAAPAPTTPDAHAGHNMPARPPATPDPHAGHDMSAMGGSMQTHPASEEGNPLVDMQTMSPTSRLDDPGIGLRDNGRRVMWSDLEDNAGQFLVRKHTIDMPPGTKRSYRVTADALGRWAYHCHLLFHMESGMFREVRVDE